jgi:glycosyltransferase involved in cell wall biosynthesis
VSLSASIIVRNEADQLDACLTSLRGLVDEIVVVDTGSSALSVAVAEQHGALVAREPWQDDYAVPRNRALALATGDWILSVDADERVRGDFGAVRALLEDSDGAIGFRVRCVPRVGWTPTREDRLWRNRATIRFHGHILETVAPAIAAAAEAEGLRIDPLDLMTIHRAGHEGHRSDARARDEPMLVAELLRRPDRASVYDHLARAYATAGDRERAVDTWKQGIAVARARNHSHPDDRLLYVDLIQHMLAHGLIDDDLEVLVDEARAAFARIPTLELAAARLAFATGRPRDALEPLEWLVGLDEDEIIATGASYDERVFGEWSWSLIGLCRFALADDAAAAEAFRRAERYAPGDAFYVVRRRLAEARAGSSA